MVEESPTPPTLAETLAVTDSLEEAQHVLARGDDATSDMIGRAIVILRHLASLQSRLAEVERDAARYLFGKKHGFPKRTRDGFWYMDRASDNVEVVAREFDECIDAAGALSRPSASQQEPLTETNEGRDALDAARYRWLRETLHSAKGGASVTVNDEFAYYEMPEPGKEVRIQWYPNTPVGFCLAEDSTLDAAIDQAIKAEGAGNE